MIVQFLLEGVRVVFEFVLGLLPTLESFALPDGFSTWFNDLFALSGYFMPLVDFMIMLGIWFVVTNFEFIWKLIQRIWDALPFT